MNVNSPREVVAYFIVVQKHSGFRYASKAKEIFIVIRQRLNNI